MTEHEALRLQDQILDTPCNLRVDCICPSSWTAGRWELVVTDIHTARQFLVTDPGQVREYLQLAGNSKSDVTRSANQGLLF